MTLFSLNICHLSKTQFMISSSYTNEELWNPHFNSIYLDYSFTSPHDCITSHNSHADILLTMSLVSIFSSIFTLGETSIIKKIQTMHMHEPGPEPEAAPIQSIWRIWYKGAMDSVIGWWGPWRRVPRLAWVLMDKLSLWWLRSRCGTSIRRPVYRHPINGNRVSARAATRL